MNDAWVYLRGIWMTWRSSRPAVWRGFDAPIVAGGEGRRKGPADRPAASPKLGMASTCCPALKSWILRGNPAGLDLSWGNGQRAVGPEVVHVEGQQMWHAVDIEQCHQPRVVNLFAANPVPADKP